jgi:hypothetical protein
VAILGGGGAAAYFKTRTKVLTVQTERVARRNLVETVTATGKIQPVLQVKITMNLDGTPSRRHCGTGGANLGGEGVNLIPVNALYDEGAKHIVGSVRDDPCVEFATSTSRQLGRPTVS